MIAVAAMLVTTSACGNDSSSASQTTTNQSAPLYEKLPASVKKAGEIVVASPLSNAPYIYTESDGKTTKGIVPELAKALEPVLGVKFRFVNTPFPGLIPGLQAQKFDMIWGVVTDTKEREKIIDFVDYQKDGATFLVRAGNPKNISDMMSICGNKISSLSGSTQTKLLEKESENCVAAGKPPMEIKLYDGAAESQLAVQSGNADVFFTGLGAGLYAESTAPEKFEVVGDVYQDQLFGAGFAKSNTELRDVFQSGIKKLVDDGSYVEVFKQGGLERLALSGSSDVTVNGAAE
ncbi:ABC transporter substrate-binding protein [Arthrobacter sp. StoSoilB22]|uniref:ABC transporter substrate-binding protein n=1 Tax=Arthrobacter sp. StoSoilB22 TaxID=2830996 RepID=UPI001CC63A44|nr:ABC transporter substrate-binding protein [Arthrobacter sp. StoSoilB22]